jgi:hypothetical protein
MEGRKKRARPGAVIEKWWERAGALGQSYLKSDPCVGRSDLGYIECKACHSTHRTAESYMAHAANARHVRNARRICGEKKKQNRFIETVLCRRCQGTLHLHRDEVSEKPAFYYRCVGDSDSHGVFFQFHIPELADSLCTPGYRIERDLHSVHVAFGREDECDEAHLLLVADLCLYGKRGFRLPKRPICSARSFDHFDSLLYIYTVQIIFR